MMRPMVPQGRIAHPGRVLVKKSARCLPRNVAVGNHHAGNSHYIGVLLEEANSVLQVRGMKLDVVIEKRNVLHIERHLADGGIALRRFLLVVRRARLPLPQTGPTERL